MIAGGTQLLAVGAALIALGLGGCGGDDDDSGTGGTQGAGGEGTGGTAGEGGAEGEGGAAGEAEPGGPETVEIFSWWSSGREAEALQAIIDVHHETYPDAEIINRALPFPDEARDELEVRMQAGDPPDTFQAYVGGDLLQWVGDTQGETLLEDLDDLAEQQGWLDVFPAPAVQFASSGGHLYGVPIGIHRVNTLYYSIEIFEEQNMDPPGTYEELKHACIDLKAAGITPLGLGNLGNWTLAQVAFEMIMPAIAGAGYYHSFWIGNEDPSDPRVEATLTETLWFYCGDDPTNCDGYFNENVDEIDWTAGMDLLVNGQVAMAPMGDWARVYLESRDWVAGVDFGAVPFPALEGVDAAYVFTADTFNLPKGANNPGGARRLLRTMGSVEGQVAFSAKKGSIPVRTDIDAAEYDQLDAVHAQTMQDFKDAEQAQTLVLALSGLLIGDTLKARQGNLRDAMEEGSIEIIADFLENNYSALQD
jgi:glucose/mannose transport system substrate-binding protein